MKLKCKTVPDMLTRLLDGELTRTERMQVLGHLCSCGKCRQSLEDMLEVDNQLSNLNRELNNISPGNDFTGKVMSKIPALDKENVLLFLRDLQQSDSSVWESITPKGTEGIMEHARNKNISFSMADFKKVLLEINGMSDDALLSEEELSEVVGGVNHTMDLRTLSQTLLKLIDKHYE